MKTQMTKEKAITHYKYVIAYMTERRVPIQNEIDQSNTKHHPNLYITEFIDKVIETHQTELDKITHLPNDHIVEVELYDS